MEGMLAQTQLFQEPGAVHSGAWSKGEGGAASEAGVGTIARTPLGVDRG